MLVAAVWLSGCASAPRTTRLTAEDFEATAAAMANSLARSDAIAARGPDAERWTIALQKGQNLTSDVMQDGEQWYVLGRLQASLPLREMADDYAIDFVIPAEQARRLRDDAGLYGLGERVVAEAREPTHVMTGTWRSVTRAYEKGRTDAYLIRFELIDIRPDRPPVPVWTDVFEFKREAKGKIWD